MNFIIFTPKYSEKQGGVLILHHLCDYLNRCGYPSYLWPTAKKKIHQINSSRKFLKFIKHILSESSFSNSKLNTPIASNKDLTSSSIVIYPEVIKGNPLKGKHVVRYLLHKPGFHTNILSYSKKDYFIYYQEAFNLSNFTYGKASHLYFPVILDHIFNNNNNNNREGTCYILRKGKNRPLMHNLDNGIIIDNLSNKEIAEIFNKVEFCVSYDLHSFYSHYAALCGCKSIVVPDPNLTKEEWVPNVELRYGIAYGEDDLQWAEQTKGKMLQFLEQQKNEAQDKIGIFARSVIEHFNL